MPVVIDLTGVSVEGPQPLDAGTYPSVITKASIAESKNSGEDTLYLELSVGDEGRNLKWNCSLRTDQLWRLKRLLVNLGLEIPEGDFEFDEAELVGVECQAEVIQEPHYRDKKRKTNRIQSIVGANGDGSEDTSWG